MDRDLHDQRELQAIAAGEASAFEAVYRRTKDALWSVALPMLGNREDAEDVLHDVYLGLVRRAGTLQLRGALSHYLMRACVHRIVDLRRRRAAEQRRAGDVGAVTAAGFSISADGDPLQHADRRDRSGRAARALAALPEEQRSIVVLRLFGPFKFREIAEQLSISIDTVQSRYRSALASLRRQLDPQRTGEPS